MCIRICINYISVPSIFVFVFRYTSIGDKTNTLPNPNLLRRNTVTGEEEFMHADQLLDQDNLERAGRL